MSSSLSRIIASLMISCSLPITVNAQATRVIDTLDYCLPANVNGITDNSVCIQNAIHAVETATPKAALHVSCGAYLIGSATPILHGSGWLNASKIFGDGGCSQFITDVGGPSYGLAIDTAGAWVNGIVQGLTFVRRGGGAGGLHVTTSTSTGGIYYSTIEGIRCIGPFFCITFDNPNDSPYNWSTLSDITTVGYGTLNVDTGVYFKYGTGTGWIIRDSHLVTVSQGILFSAEHNNGTDGVGDMTIMNIQHGGKGTGVYGSPAAGYKARIRISNSQYDAGISTGVYMPNYDHISFVGNTVGGGVTNNFTGNTSFYCASLQC